jgi:colanic acid/amylovoran biosynthesis glycosyltransferase
MHGYDLYQNPNWAMLKICLDACSRVITISEFNRRLLRKKYPDLTDDKLHVVRLSADMPEDVDLFSKVKLLIVGGFQPRKGYDILLRAIRSLGRPDLHLWIVGYKGPVDVRGLVQELQLQKHVTILGQISDDVLKVLYQACDIFCMPSRFDQDGVGEGLPVALMEAMSYRKAVIATRHTGIPELVPDVLVDENDVEGLARGIAALADAPEQRRSMGERNRRIVEREYSNENVKRLLETLRP